MKIRGYVNLLGIAFATGSECPCTKIGDDGFGQVRMGNTHADQSGMIKFYGHVDTPVGNEQKSDFQFILMFSENISQFKQYFAEDNAEDDTNLVVITPGQNQISGDPYTFNFEGLSQSEDVQTDAWYCEESIEDSQVASCVASETNSDENSDEDTAVDEDVQWDCESYESCILKFDSKKTYYEASTLCDSNDGMLPRPQNFEENQILVEIGSTWIDLWVNEKIVMNFENFEVRQRAFLDAEDEGKWKIRHADEEVSFFCVKKKEKGCRNVFSSTFGGNILESGVGGWFAKKEETMAPIDDATSRLDEEYIFEPGSSLQYACGKKMTDYKPWRKPRKAISLKCVRMMNGDWDFAECNNRRCTKFDRISWFDGIKKVIGSSSTFGDKFCPN